MKTTSNEKAVTNDILICSPLSLVWYAWTMSERVSEWFAPETKIEAKKGGAFELYFVPGNKTGMNTRGCKITKLVVEKELHFTWKGPDQFESLMNNENELTTVKVLFEAVNKESTKVTVDHAGFMDNEEWLEAYNWHQMAWSGVLASLKSSLEKGEGILCCQPQMQ